MEGLMMHDQLTIHHIFNRSAVNLKYGIIFIANLLFRNFIATKVSRATGKMEPRISTRSEVFQYSII